MVDINNVYQYDAAGNMTHDASHSYTYDAENRVTAVDAGSTANYYYDAQGYRVHQLIGTTWNISTTCRVTSFQRFCPAEG
jgi:YD repeat-containing protein